MFLGLPCGSAGKEFAYNVGDLGSTLGWEYTLEKGKATHSSILAWTIPWSHKELDMTEGLSLCIPKGIPSVLTAVQSNKSPSYDFISHLSHSLILITSLLIIWWISARWPNELPLPEYIIISLAPTAAF